MSFAGQRKGLTLTAQIHENIVLQYLRSAIEHENEPHLCELDARYAVGHLKSLKHKLNALLCVGYTFGQGCLLYAFRQYKDTLTALHARCNRKVDEYHASEGYIAWCAEDWGNDKVMVAREGWPERSDNMVIAWCAERSARVVQDYVRRLENLSVRQRSSS